MDSIYFLIALYLNNFNKYTILSTSFRHSLFFQFNELCKRKSLTAEAGRLIDVNIKANNTSEQNIDVISSTSILTWYFPKIHLNVILLFFDNQMGVL
jgi:hypothetical protein